VGHFWYDVVCYSDRMLKAALEWVGADRLMMGTDSPFMGDTTPDIKKIVESTDLLDADQKEAVFGGNARRFLHLDDADSDE
jgi:predicted TIM-barrel fold metal-dependent hydrolase